MLVGSLVQVSDPRSAPTERAACVVCCGTGAGSCREPCTRHFASGRPNSTGGGYILGKHGENSRGECGPRVRVRYSRWPGHDDRQLVRIL
eukprot:2059355-Pyramimonas_sp.AAC.1